MGGSGGGGQCLFLLFVWKGTGSGVEELDYSLPKFPSFSGTSHSPKPPGNLRARELGDASLEGSLPGRRAEKTGELI